MNVILLAHTQLSETFLGDECTWQELRDLNEWDATDGQAVALTAIRTCYAADRPSEIIDKEGRKYFGDDGKEADRLIKHIVRSGHTSTFEHISFTFAVEGVSRALLAQLTRHRVGFAYSVQSQRYVRMGSDDKIGGFDYVTPETIQDKGKVDIFTEAMSLAQSSYDRLRKAGIAAEDARAVLPNAAATNLVLTVNLRALLDFYSKRKPGSGAQKEISQLAERLKEETIKVEPWLKPFFEGEAE